MGFFDAFFGGQPDRATFAKQAISTLRARGEQRPIGEVAQMERV